MVGILPNQFYKYVRIITHRMKLMREAYPRITKHDSLSRNEEEHDGHNSSVSMSLSNLKSLYNLSLFLCQGLEEGLSRDMFIMFLLRSKWTKGERKLKGSWRLISKENFKRRQASSQMGSTIIAMLENMEVGVPLWIFGKVYVKSMD